MNTDINNEKKIKMINEMIEFAEKNILNDTGLSDSFKYAQQYFIMELSKIEGKNLKDYQDRIDHIETKLNEKSKNTDIDNNISSEDYISQTILNRNDEITVKYKELSENFNDILKNPNDRLMETWVNNMSEFCKTNNFDQKLVMDHFNEILSKKSKNMPNATESKKDEKIEDKKIEKDNINETNEKTTLKETKIEKKPEILRIKNIKRAKYGKGTIASLSFAALCIVLDQGIAPIGYATCICYGMYRLVKNRMHKKDIMELFNKYNISYDPKTNAIIDENGVIIDENYANKSFYNNIKKELKDLNSLKEKSKFRTLKDEGKLNFKYQTSRLLGKLANITTVKNVIKFGSLNKNRISDYKYNFDEEDEIEYTNEIPKKGMGGL